MHYLITWFETIILRSKKTGLVGEGFKSILLVYGWSMTVGYVHAFLLSFFFLSPYLVSCVYEKYADMLYLCLCQTQAPCCVFCVLLLCLYGVVSTCWWSLAFSHSYIRLFRSTRFVFLLIVLFFENNKRLKRLSIPVVEPLHTLNLATRNKRSLSNS